MESETMTITEICSLTGINLHTLKFRLWKWKIKPVSRGLYDRETVLEIARIPVRKPTPKQATPGTQDHSGDLCSRCGRHDYGNDCRGGLCLNCWCHDYCIEHHL